MYSLVIDAGEPMTLCSRNINRFDMCKMPVNGNHLHSDDAECLYGAYTDTIISNPPLRLT
jgi:hypothetical protein